MLFNRLLRMRCLSVLVFVLSSVLCQEVQELPPQVGVVCAACSCLNITVDCHSKGVTLFGKDDWNAIEIQPLHVDLSGNSLPVLTQFPTLPTYTLNLSRCAINTIEEGSFKNLENLTSLDLSYNELTTTSLVQHVFMGPVTPDKPPHSFKLLTHLDLSHNELHTLPEGVFRFLSSITTLDLSGNPLAVIDVISMAALADLAYLTELKLADCELESIPEGLLRRLSNLEHLDLSGNRFETVPSVLAEATHLVTLKLNHNPIKRIEATDSVGPLQPLRKLQELHINRLSTLEYIGPNALGGLESLTTLQLRHNPRLSSVDPSFLKWTDQLNVDRWPILTELQMNNNNLSEISSSYLMRWDKLTSVDVSHNPFVCECSNQWMVDVLMPIIDNVDVDGSSDNMMCLRPPDLRGMTFKQLSASQKKLPCQELADLASLPDPQDAVVMGIMIGIFVTFPIVLVVILMWRRGYFRRCRGKPDRRRPQYFDDEAFY